MGLHRVYLLWVAWLLSTVALAQSDLITLSGIVRDVDDQVPLGFSMVILTPEAGQAAFSQADAQGAFSLPIPKGQTVRLEAFYLGYADTTYLIGPFFRDFNVLIDMRPVAADLTEVVVRDTLPPISRQRDTVTYNAESFATGRERKVNELIDELPGLSIDENNKITYLGQPVQDVLVEGKPFFGGNAELAVTGLPADAVDRIQVLENYNPLGFSLSPEDQERIALNIQLRPEKKNIYFGEGMASSGPPRNYRGRVDLFNYARSRNVYFIAGGNNVNDELLSSEQRWQLLGGPMTLRQDNAFAQLADFDQFVPRLHTIRSYAQLAALGSDFTPFANTTVHLYGIVSHQQDRFRSETFTLFNPTPNVASFREQEGETGLDRHTAGILRLKTKTTLAHQQVLSMNVRLRGQTTHQSADQRYQASNAAARRSNSIDEDSDLAVEGVVEYVKRFSKGHSNHFTMSLRNRREEEDLRLLSDVPLLQSLPEQSAGDRNVLLQELSIPGRHWSINDRYVHRFGSRVYFSMDVGLSGSSERVRIHRIGEGVPPEEAKLKRKAQSTRLSLTTIPGEWKLTSAVELRRAARRWDGSELRSTVAILPILRAERTFANIGEVEGGYTRTLGEITRDWFLPAPYIRSFTTYRLANSTLEPYTSSEVYVSFRRSNPFTYSSWSVLLTHRFSEAAAVLNTLETQGNERALSFANSGVAVNSTSLHGHWQQEYDWGNLRLRLIGRQALDYTQSNPATEVLAGREYSLFLLTSIRKFLGEKSDIRLRIRSSRNQFRRGEASNVNYNIGGSLVGKVQAGNWRFFPEVELQGYQITAVPLWLIRVEGSIEYHRRHSAWTFEIRGAAPLRGNELLAVYQQNLFYREQRRGIFPAFLLAGAVFDF